MKALRLFTVLAALAGSIALPGTPVPAQGVSPRESDMSGENASGSAPAEETGGPIAPVGAGTIDAVTTGSSGSSESGGGAPGEVPPLPNASLCDDYRDSPAYQSCLLVVLGQKEEE